MRNLKEQNPFCFVFCINIWKDFHQNAQYWNLILFVIELEYVLFADVLLHFSARKFYRMRQWRGLFWQNYYSHLFFRLGGGAYSQRGKSGTSNLEAEIKTCETLSDERSSGAVWKWRWPSWAPPHSEHRFPAPSSKLCQIWLRHWRGTLYLRVAVHQRGQCPP